jgi:hypothetical protein
MESPIVKYQYFKLIGVLFGKMVKENLEGLAIALGHFKQKVIAVDRGKSSK